MNSATSELDELYAEKGSYLDKIQLLEDEINKLSNNSPDLHSLSLAKSKKNRQSYIPVRVKPTSTQNRLRFAKGSTLSESSVGPPQKKPPEPKIPPPPGILQSAIKSSSMSNQEIDVFSKQFSPQKFLDSLRLTYLGEDFGYSTTSQSNSQNCDYQASRRKVDHKKINYDDSPSPSLSSETSGEWQSAEKHRVDTRRKIMSPSSAFFPVFDVHKVASSRMPPDRSNKAVQHIKKSDASIPPAPEPPCKLPTASSDTINLGEIDVNDILARANQIVEKHQASEDPEDPRHSTDLLADEVISTPSVNSCDVWTMMKDPQSERYYYYNNQTHECTWERPVGDETMVTSQHQDYNYENPILQQEQLSEESITTLREDSSSSNLPSIVQEDEELDTTHLSPIESQIVENRSPKSSFASAALRHIQRTQVQWDKEPRQTGKDEITERINVNAALALADAILLKRNIATLDLETHAEESSLTPPSTTEEKSKKNKVKFIIVKLPFHRLQKNQRNYGDVLKIQQQIRCIITIEQLARQLGIGQLMKN